MIAVEFNDKSDRQLVSMLMHCTWNNNAYILEISSLLVTMLRRHSYPSNVM